MRSGTYIRIHAHEDEWQSGVRSCVMPNLSTHLVQELHVHAGTVMTYTGACFSYRKVRIVRNLRFVNLGTFLRRSVIAFLEAFRK